MIKYLIENNKIEWYQINFSCINLPLPHKNSIHKWVKDANEALQFNSEKEANEMLHIIKQDVNYFNVKLFVTEHEFIDMTK